MVAVQEAYDYAEAIGAQVARVSLAFSPDSEFELARLRGEINNHYPQVVCREPNEEFVAVLLGKADPAEILVDHAGCSSKKTLNLAIDQGLYYQNKLRESAFRATASCAFMRQAAAKLNSYLGVNRKWINTKSDKIWKPAIKLREDYDSAVSACNRDLAFNQKMSAATETLKGSLSAVEALQQSHMAFVTDLKRRVDYKAAGILAQLARVARDNWLKIAFIAFLVFFSKPLRKAAVYFIASRVVTSDEGLQLVASLVSPDSSAPKVSKSEDFLDIHLGDGEVLYVRPQYLQVVPSSGKKGTRWIFDWRAPLTSLAAGLSSLTKISGTGSTPIRLVPRKSMTATLSEISLAAGQALSVRAGAIAAVVAEPNSIPRFRKIWHLFRWQSLLMGRFRHLVVVGPCRIVLEGSHTLLVDEIAGTRQFEEAAIVAFSADLAMNMVRTETFGAYLTDARDAFQRTFTGNAGVVIYQRIAGDDGSSQSESNNGNALEMAIDVCMSAVGI
jgi:hypothetical protein